MKRLINLGIVLGIILVTIGCQKEDFSPANGWEKTTPAASNSTSGDPGTIFEPNLPSNGGGTAFEPGTVFEPAPGNGGGTVETDDRPGFSNEYPDGTIFEPTDLPELPGDINERTYSINWQHQKPTDPKWQYIDFSLGEEQGKAIGIPNLCPYEDCDTAIAAAVASLQVQANILCQDLYACIACCIDGYIVYAMLLVRHECGIIAPPSDF